MSLSYSFLRDCLNWFTTFWQLDDGHHLVTGGSNDSSHEAGTKNGDFKVRVQVLIYFIFYMFFSFSLLAIKLFDLQS